MSESPYSPHDDGPRAEPPRTEEARRRGVVVLRALPILLMPVLVPMFVAAASWMLVRADDGLPGGLRLGALGVLQPFVAIVVLVVFVSAIVVLVRLGQQHVSALALVGIWTLVTTVLILRTGIYGAAPAVFLIPICAAGLLIDGAASVSLAALGTVMVVSLGWLETYGMPQPDAAGQVAIHPVFTVGVWSAVFWTVAGLTSLMSGSLQKALERSRAQSLELGKLSDQLRQRVAVTSAQLVEQEREAATLAERTRLSREIHDTLAQGLAGVVVQVGAAQQALRAALAEHPPEDKNDRALAGLITSLDLAQQMARESLAEARLSVWNLRSPALGRGDLIDALRGLVSRPLPAGLSGSFEQHGDPVPVPAAVETALLRACQEAVTNAARHSGATEVQVSVEFLPDSVRLHVSDNGSGFGDLLTHVDEPGPWSGFGLIGMRERVTALGGTLELRSDRGAEVVVTVPHQGAAEAARPRPSVRESR